MDTVENYAFKEHLRQQDRERRAALSSGDYATYATLCDELGIAPEAPEEYGIGRAELLERRPKPRAGGLERRIEEQPKKQPRRRRQEAPAPEEKTILYFLRQATNPHCHYTDSPFENVEEKTQLLIKCFPDAYGAKGSQPLKYRTQKQKGDIFNKVRDKYLDQYRDRL